MYFDCSCPQCLNNDTPDIHEICECVGCHEAGCHDMQKDSWAEDCELCELELAEGY